MLVFFTSLMEFQVRYLTLFLLFFVIDYFESFWMENLNKNIQLMLEFLKAPFLILHCSYINDLSDDGICDIAIYSLYSSLICGNKLNWLLNLNLIYKTLGWDKKWLVDFNAGKTELVLFDQSNNNRSIDVKMDRSVLEDKSLFNMLGLTFSSKLDWCSYIICIAKTASKKIGALIRYMKFLSLEVALYLYKSTMHPCMEYCCYVWAGAPSCYLELLGKLPKQICKTVSPSLAASLEPLAHC